MTPKSGKAIAWLSFTLGIAVSIAGNIGHAASDGMKPGEWAGAAFWPLALMLTIEILTRVRWQRGKRWGFARVAGLLLVAGVAAVLSYRHLAGLMAYWGEDGWNAHLGPLAVDGLMLVSATALLSISKETKLPEEWQGTPEETLTPVVLPGTPPAETDFRKVLEDVLTPDVDGPELPEPKPESEPKREKSRLHVVDSVSASDTEEAAKQAFIQSEGTMTPQDLMARYGMSRSTAYRRVSTWSGQIAGRRIER